jgi:alkanesulfonate monooxygenase SsuD/methylene tetrahydromethanopterin reductase-like flavin-dependent oxidoreductase (luciferase family)
LLRSDDSTKLHAVKISIGLPNWLPVRSGRDLVDFARRAEQAGFASLGTIGRTVFDSHEELIALAACAAVTERIGLATTVAIGPVRESILLAKQAATLDAISGGRLALGLGVGWRRDDFVATGTADAFEKRGTHLEAQIATLRRVWSGAKLAGVDAAVGPAPARRGGPEIWIGGSTPSALARAGRLADGFLAVAAPAGSIAEQYEVVAGAAGAAGRTPPRFLGARYFVLGDDARPRAEANVRAYYGIGGEAAVRGVTASLLTSATTIRDAVRELDGVGVEEAFFWTTDADLEQVERLAKVVF